LTAALLPVLRGADDLNSAFSTIARERPHATFVLADRLLLAHRTEIVHFAASSLLPAMYPYWEYVGAGGLMS
jgi:hypothetical protein